VGTLQGRFRVVLVSAVLAAALILAWTLLGAGLGGDLAAQYAWTGFARSHPTSAYDLAWYGGMHPASYSPLSPYVMAWLGVSTTAVLSGAISAGLLAQLLTSSSAVRRPWWPALYGSLAMTANAISGRTTFSLGTMFGLAAVTVVLAKPRSGLAQPARIAGAVVLSALATAASPVAGLFVGIVAAALWLSGQRSRAYAIGVPPALTVLASAWLFPFGGRQPMHLTSVILPLAIAAICFTLIPRQWRTLRIGAALYAVAVVASWAVPSPVGSNIVRLGLVFGGVPLVALATNGSLVRINLPRLGWVRPGLRTTVLAGAIALSSIWQVSVATSDAIAAQPDHQQTWSVAALVQQLEARGAAKGRTEAVPRRNHQESATLAQYVNLARGWNRQADADRNPLFYDGEPLTASAYRSWLDTWAVRFVVVSEDKPDPAAKREWTLIRDGLPYLHPVWSDSHWVLYQVDDPAPLAESPAVVDRFDAAALTLHMPRAGTVVVKIRYSPWLSLVDENGNRLTDATVGCLSASPSPTVEDGDGPWLVLHAQQAGTYRVGAPYALPRGSACEQTGSTG